MTQFNGPGPNAGQFDEDESDKSLSLMGGVARPEGLPEAVDLDYQSMKGPNRLLSHGSLLIVMVFVVAAGSIYVMKISQGKITSDPGTKTVEAQIEQWMAKLSRPEAMPSDDPLLKRNINALFSDTEAIVAMFSEDMTKRQVPLEFVQKNPFALQSDAPAAVAGQPQSVRDNRGNEKLRTELADLELQTIMLGSRPAAVISGEIVMPGQKIGSFTVTRINQFSVELTGGGQTYTLSMEKPEENGSATGRGRGR